MSSSSAPSDRAASALTAIGNGRKACHRSCRQPAMLQSDIVIASPYRPSRSNDLAVRPRDHAACRGCRARSARSTDSVSGSNDRIGSPRSHQCIPCTPRTPVASAWSNSVLIEGDAAEGIAALKTEDGPELQVHGSGA